MATVDEILTRQAYAAGDETWTKDNNYPSYTMYAEPEYVPVTNKRIADFNDQVSVKGEQNAQFVGFQLPRYDDAMDLTKQNLYIHYQTVYGGSDGVPCNVSWSDNYVRMCWMIPGQATQEPGSIQMMIYATGTDSTGDRTIWKTLPATYTIHDGLEIGGGIPEPDQSWYEQFVQQMEGKVSTSQGYANDAQASKVAAAGSATAAAQSATASAQALAENKDYVESQKETFVGYNKRESDLQYANALIGSASGTGRVTVGDAWEAPIPDLRISGESEQVSTTGKNLCEMRLPKGSKDGLTYTPNSDGSFTLTGTNTSSETRTFRIDQSTDGGKDNLQNYASGQYTLSITTDSDVTNLELDLLQNNTWKAFIQVPLGQKYKTVDIKDATNCFIVLAVPAGGTVNIAGKIQLERGPLTSWEPYTGGQPSPSPDYPQPIISTGTITTGAQLLDIKDKNYVYLGISMTVNNGVSALKGTATDNATLWYAGAYLSSEVLFTLLPGTYTVTDCQLWWSDGTERVTQKGTFTVAEPFEVTGVSTVTYSKGKIVEETLYPMLNAGSIPKPWEPYTGGKPSPSEEYPQPMDVTVTGANLFDASLLKSMAGGTWSLSDGGRKISVAGINPWAACTAVVPMECVRGKTVTLSGNIESRTNVDCPVAIQGRLTLSDGRLEYYAATYKKMAITIPEDAQSFKIELITNNRNTALDIANTTVFTDVLLSFDAEATWEPFAGYQTATIQLTAPLYGIGEYRDRILCKDGEWGVERNILLGKLTEDTVIPSAGSMTSTYPNCIIDNRYTAIYSKRYNGLNKARIYSNEVKATGYCNIAQAGIVNDWNIPKGGRDNIYTINSLGAIYITVPITALGVLTTATIAEVNTAIKQYVTDHDVYVMFVLDTPTWEPLPAATQTALNALTTFTGTTHITITAGGPEPDVAVEYVQDTKAVIADIMAQIDKIRNGGTT